MTNIELTLDQLQTVAGGAAFMKLGDIRGEYRQVRQSKSAPGGSKYINDAGTQGSLMNNVAGSASPGGDDI